MRAVAIVRTSSSGSSGGISASGGLLQRRFGLPDAATVVMQGLLFVAVLASHTLHGRLKIFRARAG